MKSGIYKIFCKISGKSYIGRSQNMQRRIKDHKWKLRSGIHENVVMQNEFNDYGEENFEFGVIEKISENQLDDREIFWVSHFDCMTPSGFNKMKYKYKKSEIFDDEKYKKSKSQLMKEKWKDEEFREFNLKGIREQHKKQIEKYGTYAFNTHEAKEKSKETCATEYYRKKRSEIRLKELSTKEGKNRNDKILKKARNSPKRKENLIKFNEWQASDEEHKKKQAEHAKKGWSDPIVREKRIQSIKEGLRKKRER